MGWPKGKPKNKSTVQRIRNTQFINREKLAAAEAAELLDLKWSELVKAIANPRDQITVTVEEWRIFRRVRLALIQAKRRRVIEDMEAKDKFDKLFDKESEEQA